MKILAILIMLAAVTALGYYQYTAHQQQVALEQSVARLEQEKAALEAAKAQNSITALNQFIKQYPDSNWLHKALFERDKLAYHQAVKNNSISDVENFLASYPQSQWLAQAQSRLQRLQQEQKLKLDLDKKQARLEQQRKQIQLQQKQAAIPEAEQDQEVLVVQNKSTQQKSKNSLSGTDRVNRALSIYQKQRQQEQAIVDKQQQSRAQEEKLRQYCLSLKDQITQYKSRVRWYDLDNSGKRVFLSKQQVASNKQKLEQLYRERCQ